MHCQETAVEHDQTFLCIEHQEAMRHVLNCTVESCGLPLALPQNLERGLRFSLGKFCRRLTGLRLPPVLMFGPPAPNPKPGDEHDQDAAGRLRGRNPGAAAPTL